MKPAEDMYQWYYLDHQKRKKALLSCNSRTGRVERGFQEVLIERRSQRIFTSEWIDRETMGLLLESAVYAPSSCNRQAVWIQRVEDREDIECLSKILVGGKDWLEHAPSVILLWADMLAYKSPAEQTFMPYLDIGVMVQTLLLAAEDCDLGACYVNPNVRKDFTAYFKEHFVHRESHIFGGAIALGHYDLKAETPPKRESAVFVEEK